MTESELRRLVLQSARNARRAYRRADSQGEIFERWVDRQILRKTRIRSESAQKGTEIYVEFRNRVMALDAAMSDLMIATTTYQ
jgi:hypothetical protein